MYLAKLSINNFRGIKESDISISRHCILLGNNNSGKSTIIDAIGLLLGKESLVRNIGDFDFYGGNPSSNDRITIKGILTDFVTDDETIEAEWFNDKTGGVPKWLDLESGKLYNSQNEKRTYKLSLEIAFSARFDKDELAFETIQYLPSGNGDPFQDDSLNKLTKGISRKIGFFLLPSKRTWDKTISFASEIFKKVILFQDAVPSNSVYNLKTELKQNLNGIEKEEPLKSIIDRINLELQGFIGKEAKLNFLPTNTDIESVLNAITPHLFARGKINLPISSHGSGLISLQTLLLLLEFGRYRMKNNQNFILAAEEPELHLHPGMHRRLVARMRNLSSQTIITTHSPEIAAYYNPTEINIVHTSADGHLTVNSLLYQTTPVENALMKLFTVYRKETSEAIMHSKVIIPEGISDYHWINKLLSAFITTEGWNLHETIESFGIIPTQDSHVVKSFNILIHLHSDFYPFVDGDEAGNNYIKSFKQENIKPKYILQLPNNWCFEHIVAWIITPTDVAEVIELNKILNSDTTNYKVINELSSLLESKFKTYWKIHDELIDLMIQNPKYAMKVGKFIKSLHEIDSQMEITKLTHWKLNQDLSDINTQVLTMSIE